MKKLTVKEVDEMVMGFITNDNKSIPKPQALQKLMQTATGVSPSQAKPQGVGDGEEVPRQA